MSLQTHCCEQHSEQEIMYREGNFFDVPHSFYPRQPLTRFGRLSRIRSHKLRVHGQRGPGLRKIRDDLQGLTPQRACRERLAKEASGYGSCK